MVRVQCFSIMSLTETSIQYNYEQRATVPTPNILSRSNSNRSAPSAPRSQTIYALTVFFFSRRFESLSLSFSRYFLCSSALILDSI
jgi:hypothetical protein